VTEVREIVDLSSETEWKIAKTARKDTKEFLRMAGAAKITRKEIEPLDEATATANEQTASRNGRVRRSGGLPSLRAETGEGGNAAEGNVWTLSDGVLTKGDWQFQAEWKDRDSILRITGRTAGEGLLDWDGFVLRTGDRTVSDLAVNLVWNVFAAAPITEFRCDKVIFDSWAFRGNKSLVSVRAGGLRLTTLPTECFAGCTSLTNVVFDFPNVTGVGYGVFSGCTSLKADVMDILNPGITTIDAAFYGTSNVAGLTGTLTLTNVTSIEKRAFNGTGLTGVYLAGPCTNIQDSVFFNCTSLREATFDLAPDARVETENTFGGIWGSAPLDCA
jgi:hypothetical protein